MDRCRRHRIFYPSSRFLPATILLSLLLPSASEHPNVVNLRDISGPVDAQAARSVLRYGDENRADYFRLLELDGDHLIIGGADSVRNVSLETFADAAASHYTWESGKADKEDCAMRGVDQRSCRNYIRVLSRLPNNQLLLCGTNAFKPLCRVVDEAKPANNQRVISEFSGVGLAPYDPKYNNSFYVDSRRNMLFAATVADYSGADALIFRKNVSNLHDWGLRTQRHNTAFLNRPQFVGSLQTNDYVYFFFREEASDSQDPGGSSSTTYSRVARVCKNDHGGPPHYYEAEWTSFVKARLNCSIPERKPFYFDEIVSISDVVVNGGDGRRLVYATFVSEFNFLRHSVICAFDVAEIDALFRSSDLLAMGSSNGGRPQWERRRRDESTRRVGQCQSDSRLLSGDEVTSMRRYPLMADAVPSAFPGGAVGIYRGDDHYSQIAVLSGVRTLEGTNTLVVYVATTRGNVIKMVNVAAGAGSSDGGAEKSRAVRRKHSEEELSVDVSEDPLTPVAVFQVAKTPIRRLLIAKGKYLIAVTDSVVYRLPLHQCASMSTCDECIGSRDPHCVWHQSKCTFIDDDLNNKPSRNLSYQDVFKKQKGDICAELAAKETTLATSTTTTPTTTPLPTTLTTANRHANVVLPRLTTNANASMQCKCEGTTSGKCPCNQTTVRNTVAPLRDADGQSGSNDGWPLESVPWWVWLIIALAILQTLGCILLSCKFYAVRRRRITKACALAAPNKSTLYTKSTLETGNYASVPNYQSRGEIISAYGPVSCITNGYGNKGGGGGRGSKLQHTQSVKEARRSWFFPFPTCGGDTKDTSISSSSSTNSTGNTSLTSSNGGAVPFRSGTLSSMRNGYSRGASLPNGLNSFGKLHRMRVDGGDDVRIHLDGAMTPSGTLPRY